MKRREILQKLNIERARQDSKCGYPQKNTLPEWGIILGEEVGEAMKELNELHFRQPALPSLALGCLITELIQTAAVAVSMVEHLTEYGIAVDDRHPVCVAECLVRGESPCVHLVGGNCEMLSDDTVKQPCIEGPCEFTANTVPEPPKAKKYVCVQNCPECEGHPCKTDNPQNEWWDRYGCHVGNLPIWKEVPQP